MTSEKVIDHYLVQSNILYDRASLGRGGAEDD